MLVRCTCACYVDHLVPCTAASSGGVCCEPGIAAITLIGSHIQYAVQWESGSRTAISGVQAAQRRADELMDGGTKGATFAFFQGLQRHCNAWGRSCIPPRFSARTRTRAQLTRDKSKRLPLSNFLPFNSLAPSRCAILSASRVHWHLIDMDVLDGAALCIILVPSSLQCFSF